VGGSLPAERFEAFREGARALFRERVPPEALVRRADADAELPLDGITEALSQELALLEPHGAGNPRPVFLARGVSAAGAFLPVGSSGLRGRLLAAGRGIRAIAWQPDACLADCAASGRPFDVQYRISADRRGYGLEVEIVHARPGEAGAA
jgi:single-stranded-DNA-specific exonuclease